MIQANELRIGNWVYNTYVKGYMEVYPMMIHQLYKIETEGKYSNIEPILLTEEILLKAGFEDKEYTMELNSISFSWGSRIIATKKRQSWKCDNYEHIQYLHQLQNLIFALTGNELEINL